MQKGLINRLRQHLSPSVLVFVFVFERKVMARLLPALLLVLLSCCFLASASSGVTCKLGSNKDVDKAFKSCCGQAKNGEHVKLIVNENIKDVGPFSFHCDNSELNILPGVTMTSSTNTNDFADAKGWIMGSHFKDVSLTGAGVFDGSGEVWWKGGHHKHHMCLMEHNTDMTVKDVTLQNSPHWTLVVLSSKNLLIQNITINNPYTYGDGTRTQNLDCIDIGGSNLQILGGSLNCGDDNISIKGATSNFLATNLAFGTGHGASVGSISDQTVKNITFQHITMDGTENGCRIKTKTGYSGGEISDVKYYDVSMSHVNHDLVIDGLYTNNKLEDEYGPLDKMSPAMLEWIYERERIDSHSYTGSKDSAKITNIKFKSISASHTHGKSEINCNPDQPCQKVTLEDVDLDGDASCKYCVDSTYEGTVEPTSLYKSSSCSFTKG